MSELDTVEFDNESSDGDELLDMKQLNLLANVNLNNVQYSSSDVLLEALIHQICRYAETDPVKQKRLFIVICDKLHELRLLGKSYKLEELQYLRERYMDILQKLIVAAKCLVDIDSPNDRCGDTAVSAIDTRIQGLRGKLFDWSRYAHEFREMDFIARGGFGQVYKAHNILDGCDYAVKKISLKYHKIDSFVQSLREVQTLAKLNHPNIVAYKAAWLEPFDSRKSVLRPKPKSRIEEINTRLSREDRRPQTRLPMIELIEESEIQSRRDTSNSFEIEFKNSSASDSFVDFRNSSHKSETSHGSFVKKQSTEGGKKKRSKRDLGSVERKEKSSDTSSSIHFSRINYSDEMNNFCNRDCLQSEVSSQNNGVMLDTGDESIQNGEDCSNESLTSEFCTRNVKLSTNNSDLFQNSKVFPNNRNSQNHENNTRTHEELNKDRESNDYNSHEEIVPFRHVENRFTPTVHEVHKMNYFFPESQTVSMDWVTLYIQMQLCQLTLKEWLACAAYSTSSSLYNTQVLYIFKQIVQGLDYIHSQGIVHHDIKPSNIFVSHDLKLVQVGDFGLACCLLPHSPHQGRYSVISAPPPRSDHPLGTRLYAAPEQLHGLCDPKSDVYSLGIVLFEMLINFSTDMEKSKEITKLKMGHMSPRIAAQYPHYAKIITKLLDVNPKHRPSAAQILVYLESCLSSDSSLEDELSTKLVEEILEDRKGSEKYQTSRRPSGSSHKNIQTNLDTSDDRMSQTIQTSRVLGDGDTIDELRLELSKKKTEIEDLQNRIKLLESCES